MPEIALSDLEKAFLTWYKNYSFKDVDQEIAPFLDEKILAKTLNAFDGGEQTGQLERTRKAMFLTTQNVADRVETSRASYAQLEQRERSGAITLKNLAKLAEAMDCELVYAIRPKSKVTFSKLIWNKLVMAVAKHPSLRSYDKTKRAKSVPVIANRLMNDPEFKRSQTWSQRLNQV